jgi:hypothetical protein
MPIYIPFRIFVKQGCIGMAPGTARNSIKARIGGNPCIVGVVLRIKTIHENFIIRGKASITLK